MGNVYFAIEEPKNFNFCLEKEVRLMSIRRETLFSNVEVRKKIAIIAEIKEMTEEHQSKFIILK